MENKGQAQQAHRVIGQRANRLNTMIRDRARTLGDTVLGCGRPMTFACAHNWQGQEWMTPEQNAAAAEILRLERRCWKVNAIESAMINRVWAQFDVVAGYAERTATR
jgi:hypothetical protein